MEAGKNLKQLEFKGNPPIFSCFYFVQKDLTDIT